MENWKKKLNKNKIVGAVFMDLSKVFDCIPFDLLIAKMEAYRLQWGLSYFLVFMPEVLETIPNH